MKTVKSLLLGSAAAIVGTAAVQAADLRAAAPVEFVRVCDAQGAGFFFIPGTDICMKIGGFVQAGAVVKSQNLLGDTVSGQFGPNNLRVAPFFGATPTLGGAAFGAVPLAFNIAGPINDTTTFFGTARINVDTRQRTDFGVLRTFFEMAGDGQAPTAQGWVNNFVLRHAMIQISNPVGVFTAGLTFSFFSTPFPASGVTTGGAGALGGDFLGNRTARVPMFAYSANLGNGFTATVSLEDRDSTDGGVGAAVLGNGAPGQGGGTDVFGGLGSQYFGATAARAVLPDLVGNVTWSQGGNSVALSGVVVRNAVVSPVVGTATSTGWGLSLTGILNADFISRGSRAFARVLYTEGAGAYSGADFAQSAWVLTNAGAGTAAQNSLQNVGVFVANVGYTHQWTPQWRTTIQAGYAQHMVRANAAFGLNVGAGVTTNFMGVGGGVSPAAALDGRWSVNATNAVRSAWQAAGSVLWTPVNGFTVGLDLGVIQASYFGTTVTGVASGLGASRTGMYGMFHVTRTF